MDETNRLGLPLVQPAQAQKHITVNEALARLDGLVQLVLQSVTTPTPPAVAADGDCYGVPMGGANEWAGQAGQIAIRSNGGWVFAPAHPGFRSFVADQSAYARHDGADWIIGATAHSAHGAALIHEVVEFDHDISAGPVSIAANVLPGNAVVYGVTGRVVTAISGTASGFRLGVAESDNRYGSGLGLGAGSWIMGLTGTPMTYYAPTALHFTAEGGVFAAGTVRIAVHLVRLSLPRI
ncbi:MAG: DUF2793 domain-containing protein [Paracoccaceae bacterium]